MEKTAKIACTMIVKDNSESESLDVALDSIMPACAGLFVAVTGTSGEHDKIHEIVKKYGGTSISTTPETHPDIYTKKEDGTYMFSNFAAARNVSFDMVPDGYDFLTWLDADDLVSSHEELTTVANKAKLLKMDSIMFVYWYAVSFDEDGNVKRIIVDQTRERLLRQGVFKWTSRLHEVCVPKENGYKPLISKYEYDPKINQLLVWIHTANFSSPEALNKINNRNKAILEIQVKEEGYKDPRTLFNLGKVYFDLGTPEKLKEAEELFVKYRELSGWDSERAASWEYSGLISARDNNWRKCIDIYQKAIAEYPHSHLSYLRLSEAYLNLGATNFAKHWLEVAERMDAPKAGEIAGTPHEIKLLASTVSYKLALTENNLPDMKEWAKIRKDLMDGEDGGLYDEVMKADALNTAATSTFNLSKWLKDNGYPEKVSTLIDMLPAELINQPYLSLIYQNIVPPRKWGKKEIAYFASFGGPHFEKWGPKSLEKGIGGSETAVLELSNKWARSGYHVTIFCDCGDEEGLWNGQLISDVTNNRPHGSVTFVPYYKMNWNDEFNILILWRNPSLLDHEVKAKKLYYDAHDVCVQIDWTKERMDKVDKVFFKSKFHRGNLPELPESKAVIISNGIRI